MKTQLPASYFRHHTAIDKKILRTRVPANAVRLYRMSEDEDEKETTIAMRSTHVEFWHIDAGAEHFVRPVARHVAALEGRKANPLDQQGKPG